MKRIRFSTALCLMAGLALGCSLSPKSHSQGRDAGQPKLASRAPSPQSDVQQRWHDVYARLLGSPYRYGGLGTKGFDCSGLVRYAYGRFDGRRLPRTTEDLFRAGHAVKKGHVTTGDLVFYRTRGHHVSHVGIYLWGGWFLHATHGEGVTLTRLDDPYYRRRYAGARRL